MAKNNYSSNMLSGLVETRGLKGMPEEKEEEKTAPASAKTTVAKEEVHVPSVKKETPPPKDTGESSSKARDEAKKEKGSEASRDVNKGPGRPRTISKGAKKVSFWLDADNLKSIERTSRFGENMSTKLNDIIRAYYFERKK